MPEAYDNSFLPQDDPAVLEFAKYCILQQILQSPDGFSKAEEMARDPEEYVRSHCMALFAQLKDECRQQRPEWDPDVRDGDGLSDQYERECAQGSDPFFKGAQGRAFDPFDLSIFDDDLSFDSFREADPGSLRLNDGDVHRLAQEIRRELPAVIALKRSGALSLPGPRPQRIKAVPGRAAARGKGRAACRAAQAPARAERHSRRWSKEFSKG